MKPEKKYRPDFSRWPHLDRGAAPDARGGRNYRTSYNADTVRAACELILKGATLTDAAAGAGMKPGTLSAYIFGRPLPSALCHPNTVALLDKAAAVLRGRPRKCSS